jgi:hypothetical protein
MDSRVVSATLVAVLVQVASADHSLKLGNSPTTQATELRRQPTRPFRRIVTIDDKYAAIADTVPDFAGVYVSGDTVVIMLVDRARLAAARRALERVSADFPYGTRHVVARRARYNFRQLRTWKLLATNVMGREGATSLGIDHMRNRLSVGVIDSGRVAPVRAALIARGVPAEAVIVKVMGPWRLLRG